MRLVLSWVGTKTPGAGENPVNNEFIGCGEAEALAVRGKDIRLVQDRVIGGQAVRIPIVTGRACLAEDGVYEVLVVHVEGRFLPPVACLQGEVLERINLLVRITGEVPLVDVAPSIGTGRATGPTSLPLWEYLS